MSNSMRDLVIGEAELDDEEDDDSFDEETGETRPKKQNRDQDMNDSSEEEDDDDDEEEMQKVPRNAPPDAIFSVGIIPSNLGRLTGPRRLHRRRRRR